MENKYIPSLVNLDSLELDKDSNKLSFSDRSHAAANLIFNQYPEQIVRGEIELRTIGPKPSSFLVYAVGVGDVTPFGVRCKGLFYLRELNKYQSLIYYTPLHQLKSFTSLSPKEKFE